MGLADNIQKTYAQAAKEVKKKLDEYTKHYQAQIAVMQKRLESGKISQEDYNDWLERQIFRGKRWQEKLDDITKTYVDADGTARELVGDRSKNVFARFANSTARDIQNRFNGGVSFDMYDRYAVERLLKENPQMLPEWKINEKKDYRWNAQRVQNAITQGIIQGESIPQLARRLTSELSAGNEKHMKMFARTAMTGAQNAGRIERLHEAQDMGIVVKKKWLAAHDDRVRDAHAELDGQEVGIDEPFHSSLGDIMYPGDPTADPANVYNCRCTLTYVYDVQASRENLQEQEEAQKEKTIEKQEVQYKDRIAKMKHEGNYTADEYVGAGKVIDEEVNRRVMADNKELLERYDAVEEEHKRLQELDKETVKRIREETSEDWRKQHDKLAEYYNSDEYKHYSDIRRELRKLDAEVNKAYAEKLSETLRENAEYGRYTKKDILTRMAKNGRSFTLGMQDVLDATGVYPREWTEKVISDGGLFMQRIKGGRARVAGEYIWTSGEFGTSIHEMGHIFENHIPGLKEAADEFYLRRTKGEKLEKLCVLYPGLGYKKDEETRLDNFVHPYMGKDYGAADRASFHTELLSMGFEYLLDNKRYNRRYFDKDPEMKQWLLGLLAMKG